MKLKPRTKIGLSVNSNANIIPAYTSV